MSLPAEGAAFVDGHVAASAARIGFAALERLIEEARVRFDPAAAQEARRLAADDRHFDIHLSRVTFQGAEELRALGSTDSWDVRRSVAAGDLARRQLALDLTTEAEPSAEGAPRKPRQVVLHVHLSHAALSGTGLHLARLHHRAKTHTAWTYTKVDPTTFLWRSPQGIHLLRDHTGTRILQTRTAETRPPTRAVHPAPHPAGGIRRGHRHGPPAVSGLRAAIGGGWPGVPRSAPDAGWRRRARRRRGCAGA